MTAAAISSKDSAGVHHPLMRYHGAKFRLAPWIISHFPPHRYYTEAFGGAAGVLLRKARVHGEVYNDLDGEIVNVFRVLRDPGMTAELQRLIQLTPHAREEFENEFEPASDPVERARRTLVRAAMGFASGGASKGHTGFRIDIERSGGTSMDHWRYYSDRLNAITQRLQGVLIENRPALEVLQHFDRPETLHYVDPPYLHATRQFRGSRHVYQNELTDADHDELLTCLMGLRGMVVLSGYDSPLYASKLEGWTCYERSAAASGGRGAVVRTEVLWINPHARRGGLQLPLF